MERGKLMDSFYTDLRLIPRYPTRPKVSLGNQSSISVFFAPRHGPKLVHEKIGDREPIGMVDHELLDADARVILAGNAFSFFNHRHFDEIERWGEGITLGLNANPTFIGEQHEIVVRIPENADEEISHLYVRFLITQSAAKNLDRWNDLALSLGAEFDMQLMTDDITLVPCVDFKTVMTQSRAYRAFTQMDNE